MLNILVHNGRSGAHHPAVFWASAHHRAHFLCLWTGPDVHKIVAVANVAHRFLPIFTFKAVARIYFAVGVDEEIHRAGFTWQRAASAFDVIDKSHIEESAEPALWMVFFELPVNECLKVGAHLLAVGDYVVVLVEIIGIVECCSGKLHTKRLRQLLE